MTAVIEQATSGRAKCRGCGGKIAKGEPRLGEGVENPFGDGETTLWFHPACGAMKRPEAFLEALGTTDDAEIAALAPIANVGVEHRRLPRLDRVERASTARARCRSCREPIEKGGWRIGLVFFEHGRFEPSGFIHVACAGEFFGTNDVLDRIDRVTDLDVADRAEVAQLLQPG